MADCQRRVYENMSNIKCQSITPLVGREDIVPERLGQDDRDIARHAEKKDSRDGPFRRVCGIAARGLGL
jgi:hypothetical protein